jgi:nicotinate-nucleotide pyrophosphorylase (carboxylating)
MSFSTLYGSSAVEQLNRLIDLGLEEDVGTGDATSQALIPEESTAEFTFVAREKMTVSGLFLIPKTYARLAARMGNQLPPQSIAYCEDGDQVEAGTSLMQVKGNAQLLLTGERLALNFLQRLCGVASLTASYVDAIKGTGCQLLDTRKTLPGMRYLDKYAVTCGGGHNHRLRLDDAVLIKDNHLTVQTDLGAAITAARQRHPSLKIQIECDTLEQTTEALKHKPDWILLDNMPPAQLQKAVEMAKNSGVKLEASGGITLKTIHPIAETGVTAISVGALTHSAIAKDIGLDRVIS